MTILDAITSSPINVFFTIVIGIGLAYLYCRKPSSSSSASSTGSPAGTQSPSTHHHHRHFSPSAFLHTHPSGAGRAGAAGIDPGLGVIDEEFQRSLALIERQERDMIRQEQDAAYQQSLKADREKRLKREKEQQDKEAKEKAERDEREQLERLHQRLTQLKGEIRDKLPNLRKQPEADTIVKLVFKLPDGTRIKQDFCNQDKVKYLHWFVFSLENAPLQFRMTTNFPKRDLPGRPPMPEDFDMPAPGHEQSQHDEHDTSSSSSNATTTTNDSSSTPPPLSSSSPASTTATRNTVEPDCELTLAEAGLTETQIIFVYDLEA